MSSTQPQKARRGNSVLRRPFIVEGPWRAYFDERHERDYFSNSETMAVTWECPAELHTLYQNIRTQFPTGTPPPADSPPRPSTEPTNPQASSSTINVVESWTLKAQAGYDPSKLPEHSKMTASTRSSLSYQPVTTIAFTSRTPSSGDTLGELTSLSLNGPTRSGTPNVTPTASSTANAANLAFRQATPAPASLPPGSSLAAVPRSDSIDSTVRPAPSPIAGVPVTFPQSDRPSFSADTTYNYVGGADTRSSVSSACGVPVQPCSADAHAAQMSNGVTHAASAAPTLIPAAELNAAVASATAAVAPNTAPVQRVQSTAPSAPRLVGSHAGVLLYHDPASDRPYWYDPTTGQTSWRAPAGSEAAFLALMEAYAAALDDGEQKETSATAAATGTDTTVVGAVAAAAVPVATAAVASRVGGAITTAVSNASATPAIAPTATVPGLATNDRLSISQTSTPSPSASSTSTSSTSPAESDAVRQLRALYPYLPAALARSPDAALFPVHRYPLPVAREGPLSVRSWGLRKAWRGRWACVRDGVLRVWERAGADTTEAVVVLCSATIVRYRDESAPAHALRITGLRHTSDSGNACVWGAEKDKREACGPWCGNNEPWQLCVACATGEEEDLWVQAMVRAGAVDGRYPVSVPLSKTAEELDALLRQRDLVAMSPVGGVRAGNGSYVLPPPVDKTGTAAASTTVTSLALAPVSPLGVRIGKLKSNPVWLLFFPNRIEVYLRREDAVAAAVSCEVTSPATVRVRAEDSIALTAFSRAETLSIDGATAVRVHVAADPRFKLKPQTLLLFPEDTTVPTATVCSHVAAIVNHYARGALCPAIAAAPHSTLCRSPHPVPLALHLCLSVLSARSALEEEGLLRVPAAVAQLKHTLAALAHGVAPVAQLQQPHLSAGVLKALVRGTSGGAVPLHVRNAWLQLKCVSVGAGAAPSTRGGHIAALRACVSALAWEERLLVGCVCAWLRQLSHCRAVNLMTVSNCATVMAPNMLQGSGDTLTTVHIPSHLAATGTTAPDSVSSSGSGAGMGVDAGLELSDGLRAEREAVVFLLVEHWDEVFGSGMPSISEA